MARLGRIELRRIGSSRFQTTEAAAASALSVMNTRPVLVAAHIVPVFCGVRCDPGHRAAAPGSPTPPPSSVRQIGRARADADEVAAAGLDGRGRELGAVGFEVAPDRRPSPACARRENDPWKIEPAAAGCGSAMIGG